MYAAFTPFERLHIYTHTHTYALCSKYMYKVNCIQSFKMISSYHID